MRSERGVRMAMWLMRHVGPPNEALAGDLLEEYRQGRSAWWYWMQVMEAVVAGVYRQRLRRYALNVGKGMGGLLLLIVTLLYVTSGLLAFGQCLPRSLRPPPCRTPSKRPLIGPE